MSVFQGSGLIAAADSTSDVHDGEKVESKLSTSSQTAAAESPPRRRRGALDIKLLALDMDGTLLDSSSKVLPSSVEALKAALSAGVRVCLATGKARPAAVAAMARVGLAGAVPMLDCCGKQDGTPFTAPANARLVS